MISVQQLDAEWLAEHADQDRFTRPATSLDALLWHGPDAGGYPPSVPLACGHVSTARVVVGRFPDGTVRTPSDACPQGCAHGPGPGPRWLAFDGPSVREHVAGALPATARTFVSGRSLLVEFTGLQLHPNGWIEVVIRG